MLIQNKNNLQINKTEVILLSTLEHDVLDRT